MNNTCTLKVELEGLGEAERRVAALHAKWTEIAAMAREHKDIAVMTAQVARLDLAPGDKVVITTPKLVNQKQSENIFKCVRSVLGCDVGVLILDGGVSLAVVGDGSAS